MLAVLLALVGCRDRLTFNDGGADDGGADASIDAAPIPDVPADGGMDAGPPCEGPPGLYVAGSCTELAPGVRPFAPRFALWTDGAVKDRWFYLPAGTRIDTSDPDAWVFPVGTIFWKTFSRDGLRIETRINTKIAAGTGMDAWTMRTYAWSADQLSVTPVTDGVVDALGTGHDIPPTSLCVSCHSGAAVDVGLGFSAIQLNHPGSETTLSALYEEGSLTANIDTLDAIIPGPPDVVAALGYMHANCGACHGGPSPQPVTDPLVLWVDVGTRDASFTGAYAAIGHPSGWPGAALRVSAGAPDESAIVRRMGSRVVGVQMPPVGTELPHAEGISAVRRWVLGL
jgi:hypothetical protein